MKIEVGPTGYLVKGGIWDTGKQSLEEKLKTYDKLLYLKWNPKKCKGMGIWELRRRPQYKTIVHSIQLNGIGIQYLDYKEIDLEHHVFDVPVLADSLLDKVKRCDIWAHINYEEDKTHRIENFTRGLDKNFETFKETERQKDYDEAVYQIKQAKTQINRFREDLLSGHNPAKLARYWK